MYQQCRDYQSQSNNFLNSYKTFRDRKNPTPPDIQECEWIWTHEQKIPSKTSLTEALSKAPVLKYFSESDLPKNLGDASKDALGFVQMQHGKPVTSVRRALTVAERRYSKIEKELFCPILGMERNQKYLLAKKVILVTDQKPLIFFMHEPKASAPKARAPFCRDFSNMTTRYTLSLGKLC